MQSAGLVAAREGRGYYDEKGVQSHRPEGRRIAARGGGWCCLGLNWRRVVAVCLRAGPRSLLQTGGGRPPSLDSNAVGCVRLMGPLGSAGQFMGSVVLHGLHPGLEFSWSQWR